MFFDEPVKNKEETKEKKLLKQIKIMIIQMVIYWIINIYKALQTNCNRFKPTN